MTKTHGTLIAKMAHDLALKYESRGFMVLHDHRQPGTAPAGKLGKPKSWFGADYAAQAILADLDIACQNK